MKQIELEKTVISYNCNKCNCSQNVIIRLTWGVVNDEANRIFKTASTLSKLSRKLIRSTIIIIIIISIIIYKRISL